MDILIGILVLGGLAFFTGGTVGILRLPDFYTRLHPAGKLDTLGTFLLMVGLGLYELKASGVGGLLTSLKLLLIVVFVFFSSPTATHSIVDAGVRAGLKPWVREEGPSS